MRTHYGPWQPCWISNQHQKHKSGRGPSSEHFWQVWLISVQRFQRRRFKCEKLTDGRTTDAYPWQKLTWPMARWAKKLIGNNRYYCRGPIIAKLYITHNNVASSAPSHERDSKLTLLVVIGTDCTGSRKSNYHMIMTTKVLIIINGLNL